MTLADARVLVDRLGTGDEIDPAIGERVFKTKSSVELLGLSLIVEWAKAARLVRVVRGRLVPVKKAAALLERPAELWMALFEVFGQLGPAFLPWGWGESFLRREFAAGADALLSALHGRDGAVGLDELRELAWHTVTALYVLDDATEQQLGTARRMNDRGVRRTFVALARLGAVTLTEDSAELTEAGRTGTRRLRGKPEPGDPVHQIIVTLAEVVDPPVRFGELDSACVIRYTYDFGDGWEHEVIVEALGTAEPGGHYPRCIGGEGACPPEDCGGPSGYEYLREILADPGNAEYDDMLMWMGLKHASEFDPAAFDVELVNRRLVELGAPR